MTDLVGEQRLGGAIAWGATEIPMIIVMIALLSQWATQRREGGPPVGSDRRPAQTDEELDAYNRMLAGLAEHDASRSAAVPHAALSDAEETDRRDRAGVSVLIRPEAQADRTAVQALIAAAFGPADHAGGPVVEVVPERRTSLAIRAGYRS